MGDGTGVGDGDYWKLFDHKHLWELTDISENFIPQIHNTLTNSREYFFPQKSIITEDLISNNDEILDRYIEILKCNL